MLDAVSSAIQRDAQRRESERTAAGRNTPVIFIAAFPEERIRRQTAAAGAFDFLSKPFEGRASIDCVEAALGRAT